MKKQALTIILCNLAFVVCSTGCIILFNNYKFKKLNNKLDKLKLEKDTKKK